VADTATIIGPVVRMCTDPDCHGLNACPSCETDKSRITDRGLAMAETFDVNRLAAEVPAGLLDELLCWEIRRTLAWACVPDSQGVKRMIPDGCEFAVHKGHAGIPPEKVAQHGDWEWYVAVYSGPEAGIDAILGDSPEWDGYEPDAEASAVCRRLKAMIEQNPYPLSRG
jgi:hypothetical protein